MPCPIPSDNILTIGCDYQQPKGGVAQVMSNYNNYLFPQFKCVVNSGGNSKLAKLFKAVFGWIEMLVRLTFDRHIKIVHIHTASYNSFKRSAWFVKTARLFGKRIILHIHGGGFKEYYATNPEWITSVLDQCNCIITLSYSWKAYFSSITKCPMIEVVENIISPPEILPRTDKQGKTHFLFLGLITQQKGIFDLLDVLAEHKDQLKDKIVLHIGGNGEVDKLNRLISDNRLEDFVKYEGWASGAKKTALFNLADAFILPSYTEGLPVSILEAMSYGLTILATPVGGIPEVVDHRIGYLFEPGNTSEIFNSITAYLNNPSCNKEYITDFAKQFLPDAVSKSLNKIYNCLLSKK